MADLVDNMTAAELRTKLAEYGLPVMPITASTRNLMAKKLKMVMEGKGDAKNADSRRSLAKYSSGEDSDLDTNKSTKEKAKSRRATVGGNMLPPASHKLRKSTPKKADSPAKLDAEKDSESEGEPIKTHEEVKTVTTRRITRTYKQPANDHEDYETGSDSDVDVVKPSSSPAFKTSSRSDYISSTLPSSTLRHSPSKTSALPYSTYNSSASVTDNLNSIRYRLGLTQPYNSTEKPASSSNYSSYSYNPRATTIPDEVESPYLSSFTQRLSAIKAESRGAHKDSDNINGGGYSGRSYYGTNFKRRADLSPDFKTAGEKKMQKNNLVSFAIVGIVFVFFLVVSFMYMGMRGDVTSFIEDKSNVIPLCQANSVSQKPSENCIEKDKVSGALDLLKLLYPELSARAIALGCGKDTESPNMSETDILTFISKHKYLDPEVFKTDLYNLHVLILNNPKWGVSIVTEDGTPITSVGSVVLKRKAHEAGLAVLKPSIPWKCLVFGKLYSLLVVSLVISLLVLAAFLIHKGVKMYLAYVKSRKEQIYSMVEQIIDVLSQENAEEGSNSAGQSMPISHVRDMLIPPQNREKMAAIWEAAIKFLEKNESRVRFEIENVAGEEYRALRWVSPQGSPRANRGSGARAWQGQAFETQEGSVNNLTVSPTPCLKIRHMVDKNDKNPNLKTIIQDAILEKCSPQCKILHMEIDKVSCCVYVKCASQADAGIVYQSLHGWWYEGNLITVKYLRLERYMDHFPFSPSTGPYLKLSGQ